MQCPFCHSINSSDKTACRVCGGPLRKAPAPDLSAISGANSSTHNRDKAQPSPSSSAVPSPQLLAQQSFDKDASPLINVGFGTGENSPVILVRSNGLVQLWNAQSGELSSFSIGRWFRKDSPLCCALAAANLVATGHENGAVRLHALDGRALKSPARHVGRVRALAASATHLYSGGSDGVVAVTPLAGKPESRALIDGLGALTTLAVSSDGALLAVGRDDGAIGLWRPDAEYRLARLDWTRRGHDAPIQALRFSPNGHMLVSRDKDGGLCLWAAQTSYQLPLAPQNSAVAPTFSGDNRWLALANPRGGVEVCDVALGNLFCELPPMNQEIQCLSFAAKAALLVVARAREIAIWKFL